MAQITFYTKAQCKNAAKQIELLTLADHSVEVIDLIEYDWSKEQLEYYFNSYAPADWFNLKAPKIKSGEINPKDYNKEETIKLLLEDHLFIRRPIIEVGKEFQIGFYKDKIDEWIGLQPANKDDVAKSKGDVTTCIQSGRC